MCFMTTTVSDMVSLLDKVAPAGLAEDWDNVGLQIGDFRRPVQSVWVALDPSLEVVQAACRENIDLLITHHPLIFRPLNSIDYQTPTGMIVELAIKNHLAVVAAHTNLDSVAGGINDILARRIGLEDLRPLVPTDQLKHFQYDEIKDRVAAQKRIQHDQQIEYDVLPLVAHNPQHGIGRIGYLETGMDLKSFALMVKKKLDLKSVKYAGNPALPITKAAVCSGSGGGLLANFLASDAHVYVSGDLRYHDARDTEASNRGIIDIGHFSSEYIIVAELTDRLKAMVAECHLDATVDACKLEKDPFTFI